MLDWVIVGGGPQGVHLSVRLIAEAGVSPDALVLIDGAPRLLDRWLRCTTNVGMRFLRSPSVHHIDVASCSLTRFAGGRSRGGVRNFTRPYDRPSLELFDRHCVAVIDRLDLASRHVQARAERIELKAESALVRTSTGGEIEARHVALALGAPESPVWPDWARGLASEAPGRVDHLFDPGFELAAEPDWEHVLLVGAGISGVQAALRLATGRRRVTLTSRHPLRIAQFDSDPGWLGPLRMERFARQRDWSARREMIRTARHRGSIPPEIHLALRIALAEGRIELAVAEVLGAEEVGSFARVHTERDSFDVDHVLLATGFSTARPGGDLVDDLVDAYALPCADCGYPVVDRALRWHPRLFVAGPLAELELGPVSRNLSGARRAGDRIVEYSRRAA